MSANPISSAISSILDKAVTQILGGYQTDALARLKKCGHFNDKQIAKLQRILQKTNPSNSTTTPLQLKDRILAALNPKAPIANASAETWTNRHSSDSNGKCQFRTGELPREILGEIFMQYLPSYNATGFIALGRTNKHYYKSIQELVNKGDLIQFCPGITLSNARPKIVNSNPRRQYFKVNDDPCLNKFEVFKCFWRFASDLENNATHTSLAVYPFFAKSSHLPTKDSYRMIITKKIIFHVESKMTRRDKLYVYGDGPCMWNWKKAILLTRNNRGKTWSFMFPITSRSYHFKYRVHLNQERQTGWEILDHDRSTADRSMNIALKF